MKKLLIALSFFTLSATAQTKKDSVKINQDSIAILKAATGIYQFAHDKNLGVKDFELLNQILNAYIDEQKRKGWK